MGKAKEKARGHNYLWMWIFSSSIIELLKWVYIKIDIYFIDRFNSWDPTPKWCPH